MKRHDLYIVGVYVLGFIAFLAFITVIYTDFKGINQRAIELFEKQEITNVVIDSCQSEMIVIKTDSLPYNKTHWALVGFLGSSQLEFISIENGTLNMKKMNAYSIKLYVNENIPVELKDSPRITVMNENEYQEFIKTEKGKHYAF